MGIFFLQPHIRQSKEHAIVYIFNMLEESAETEILLLCNIIFYSFRHRAGLLFLITLETVFIASAQIGYYSIHVEGENNVGNCR